MSQVLTSLLKTPVILKELIRMLMNPVILQGLIRIIKTPAILQGLLTIIRTPAILQGLLRMLRMLGTLVLLDSIIVTFILMVKGLVILYLVILSQT